jgi:hypothetical protein
MQGYDDTIHFPRDRLVNVSLNNKPMTSGFLAAHACTFDGTSRNHQGEIYEVGGHLGSLAIVSTSHKLVAT